MYQKCADLGDTAVGCYWVGVLYAKGNGVDKNLEKAVENLTKASKAGNTHADQELFLLYSTEADIKDPVKAYIHLLDGLENGVTMYQICQQYFKDNYDVLKPIFLE